MDHPHLAQLPNLCCAKGHPQLHKTETAKLKWHKRLQIVSISSTHECNSANSPKILGNLAHLQRLLTSLQHSKTSQHLQHLSFEGPCNIFLKHYNICNILKALQHLQHFENSATPTTFALFLRSVIIATP